MGPGPERERVLATLERLKDPESVLGVKALRASHPWLRLRVGDWRILFRPIEGGFWTERIVHRRDLERAVTDL